MTNCLIWECEASQCQTTYLVQQGCSATSASNILLLAVEPTAVPGSGKLSVLFKSWGCVRVICFGSAAALVLGFFGFGGWIASG